MNEHQQTGHGNGDDNPGLQAVYQEQRTWAIITYVLHLVGAVLAIPSIIGLIMNYVLLDSALPELRSHHQWQIRSFWWALFWTVIGLVLLLVFIGYFVLFAVWVWYLYRHIRGLVALSEYRKMP